jgi:hypothetical protein
MNNPALLGWRRERWSEWEALRPWATGRFVTMNRIKEKGRRRPFFYLNAVTREGKEKKREPLIDSNK